MCKNDPFRDLLQISTKIFLHRFHKIQLHKLELQNAFNYNYNYNLRDLLKKRLSCYIYIYIILFFFQKKKKLINKNQFKS